MFCQQKTHTYIVTILSNSFTGVLPAKYQKSIFKVHDISVLTLHQHIFILVFFIKQLTYIHQCFIISKNQILRKLTKQNYQCFISKPEINFIKLTEIDLLAFCHQTNMNLMFYQQANASIVFYYSNRIDLRVFHQQTECHDYTLYI